MNTLASGQSVQEPIERHILSVIVDNEPGVLARVASLFSGRGYNIESLTVTETQHDSHISRLTIVTRGTSSTVAQIRSQLNRLVPVHRVIDLTLEGLFVERELCLVKVAGTGEARQEALRLAQAFGARTLDATLNSFVFELAAGSDAIERFINVMATVGLVDVCRTGSAATTRGAGAV
ncbi:MAG: acetolactate synthase small subunit [Methylobacteriaceae bacterium]|jgi:acetolactate synthase-1/3 small subunit|nr:acetolactate synthase small subunit [Methylobacteriaceae bacterium]